MYPFLPFLSPLLLPCCICSPLEEYCRTVFSNAVAAILKYPNVIAVPLRGTDTSSGRLYREVWSLNTPIVPSLSPLQTWQKDHKLSVVFMFYCRLYQFACYVTASSCIVISCIPCRINRFRCPLKRPERRHLRLLCFSQRELYSALSVRRSYLLLWLRSSILLCLSQKELHSALTQKELHSTLTQKEFHSTSPQSEKAPFCFASDRRRSSILLFLSQKELHSRSSILLFCYQKELHSTSLLSEGAPFYFASGAPFYFDSGAPFYFDSEGAPLYFLSVRRSSILLCCFQKELNSTLLLSEGAAFYFDSEEASFFFASVSRGSTLLWLRRSFSLLCCYQKELHLLWLRRSAILLCLSQKGLHSTLSQKELHSVWPHSTFTSYSREKETVKM